MTQDSTSPAAKIDRMIHEANVILGYASPVIEEPKPATNPTPQILGIIPIILTIGVAYILANP